RLFRRELLEFFHLVSGEAFAESRSSVELLFPSLGHLGLWDHHPHLFLRGGVSLRHRRIAAVGFPIGPVLFHILPRSTSSGRRLLFLSSGSLPADYHNPRL